MSKKDLDGSDVGLSSSTMWFKNGFILPYSDLKILLNSKEDIKLQQNTL
ncbi:hypothetical protein [Mucilaginibacter frigoritolerans]|nr:hypothetical protein [Mucilaginibacter frigoritolerans]